MASMIARAVRAVPVRWVAAAITVALLGYAAFLWASYRAHDEKLEYMGLLVDPPQSLEQLINESDLIVVGRIDGITDQDVVYPSGYNPATNKEPAFKLAVKFTNFSLKVDRYIKGSGPNILLLRQHGDFTKGDGPPEFPKPKFGRSMLLFLTRESRGENLWFSHLGPWGRFVEEDGVVKYYGGDNKPVPFVVGLSMGETVKMVEKLASEKGRSP